MTVDHNLRAVFEFHIFILSIGVLSEAVAMNWQKGIERYCSNIEEQTKESLKLIKPDLIRNNLLFAKTFEDYFLRSANRR